MDVIVKRNPVFADLYNVPSDAEIMILIGGRGSGKTYEASKFIAYSATIKGKRCQVLRDEKSTIRESILNEILLRYDTANINGAFDGQFTRLENGIKSNETGEMQVFAKGFRASSLEKKANMKSVSNVDLAVVEEGEDIRDEDKFNTFADSIRNEGSLIVFILNTPDVHHWIIKTYFNLVPVTVDDEPDFDANDLDGYFKIEQKKIPGVYSIFTTYHNNPHLPEKTVKRYQAYGDKKSHLYNPHHYLVSIKGYANTGMKGQYFKRYKYITLKEYLDLPYNEAYGLDFGTTSPAGTIGMKIHKEKLFVRELNYEGLELKPLGFKLNDLGFNGSTLIVADCAEPDTIRNLRFGLNGIMSDKEKLQYPVAAAGFRNIRPAPDKSIIAGLNKLLSMDIYVVETSVNLIKEFQMYCEATDRDGKSLGKPIDAYNHCIDPMRYVIQVHGAWW